MIRRGSGPPAILLHGFCGGAAEWTPTIEGLAPSLDVIAPDWPGFGDAHAEPPLGSLAAMADRVIALADSLGLARFHVVGHSMSGFVVQELLLRHPDRVDRAVLYGAGLANGGSRFEPIARTIERLREEGVAATARRVCATWFVDREASPAYAAAAALGARMSLAAAVAALAACAEADYTGRLGGAANPALVVIGEHDRTFRVDDARALAGGFPNGRLEVMRGCAHAAHLEDPATFNRIVAGFLGT